LEQEKSVEKMQQIEVMLRTILEPEAKARLSNIKVVNQELYYKVAQVIFQLYKSDQLNGRVDEETLKHILSRIQQKKEFTITRK
jgi:programmed cell death protein 5